MTTENKNDCHLCEKTTFIGHCPHNRMVSDTTMSHEIKIDAAKFFQSVAAENEKLKARIAELEAANEILKERVQQRNILFKVTELEKQLSELRAENERLKEQSVLGDVLIRDLSNQNSRLLKYQEERDQLKALCETMASALEIYIGQFEKLKEKQDRLLKNGFTEACDNWVEATSDDFDLMNLAPLMEALEKFKALKGEGK